MSDEIPDGWDAPQFWSERADDQRVVHVGAADGPRVVAVEAPRCQAEYVRFDRRLVCCRVVDHKPDHWLTDPELVDRLGGALAIVTSVDLLERER